MRPEDPKAVLYYRLRSAIQDGSVDGVRQILKLRTINNPDVWRKLCPHVVWDKLRSIESDTLWFDILGSEFEECLEDSVVLLACSLGNQNVACMIVDAVLTHASRVACARCRLNPGSLFEREGPNGHSPLQTCAQKGLYEVARKLLDAGCNVNHKGFGVHRTPLHYAIQNGHHKLAMLLLENGADPNDCRALPISNVQDLATIRVFRGQAHARRVQVTVPSPFCYAIELGGDSLVEYMLSKRLCSPNSFGIEGQDLRPLTLALQGVVTEEFARRFNIVKLLLKFSAKVEKNDLLLAVRWPTAQVLNELLIHGADPNWTMTPPNWTLLHILCAEPYVGERMEKIRVLVAAGADPNARDQDGNVPLHWACSTYMREGILYLSRLENIDVNATNVQGVSPLMRLLSSANLPSDTQEIVSLLEAAPFSFAQRDNYGRNMFCYAAMSQALDLLNYLVRKGVNPQTPDDLGNFPFIYALCCGHLKVAAGLACLTKDLATDWKISHPSLNILKNQQIAMAWLNVTPRRPERVYLESRGEPLLQLGLVHGLLSLQNPSYAPRTPSRLPVPAEAIKGYEVSLFIKALLSKNYDVNIRNSRGETALCMLLKQRHWHSHLKVSVVVLLLLEHGADPNIPSGRVCPLPSSVGDHVNPFVGGAFPLPVEMFNLPPGELETAAALAEPKTPMDHALEAKNIHVATYLYLAGAQIVPSRHSRLLSLLKRRHEQVQLEAAAAEADAAAHALAPAADPVGGVPQNPPLIPFPFPFGAMGPVNGVLPPQPFIAPHPPPPPEEFQENQNLIPPPLRRSRAAASEAAPCAYFTPPHRCIVCLTQTQAPSLAILARRAVRFALRDQLQHCHDFSQLGIPKHLFDFLKMIDFD